MKPMRIVVTGAAGFIGSHICDALLAQGHEVAGVDAFIDYYPRALKEDNLRLIGAHPRFTFTELDLRIDRLDDLLEGADGVVNQAAMAGLMRSWDDLETYVGCNILAVARLIAACQRAGVERFVHASTSSVYGQNAVGDESLPTRPISPYGVTKLAAEHLLLAHRAAHGFPVIILRYFSIYGPRQRPDMAYHIFIKAMLAGEPITIYGDGRQSRANTFVADCVRGTLAALADGEVGETYNIGGGEEISLLEAIDLIAKATGTSPQIRHERPRPGDQLRTVADTSKARRAFGYQPIVRPADGLREQARWHVAQAVR
jgi:nucleoside-diphosphate-sugar epimerase